MTALPSELRRQLERTVIEAREVAEAGARAALKALAVHHHEPYPHMKPHQRQLRNHLRARARQLGDRQDASGRLQIDHLVTECAYEHWHRMLFARFLAQNNLLIEPESGVAISLAEAEELARDEGARRKAEGGKADVWDYVSRCAQQMLPQIFRPDDPLLQLSFATEHRLKLESLLASLPAAVFTASDALGWVYQFWQSKRKDEVNRSEVKIGADELPAVTQLFTEPYMVEFLLHNTLGAWWAGKKLTTEDTENAETEEELRKKLSLPGLTWDYLRFVRHEPETTEPSSASASATSAPSAVKSSGRWRPAAGTFDGWPKAAKEIKVLDPCCGSGHFLVAALHHLVPIRMAEEGLSAAEAVDAVLRDNLHGLEIDQRCCQIAAFALALAAWTFPSLPSPSGRGAGGEGTLGYRELPELHIACSGIGPQCSEDEWIELAEQSGIPMPAVGREAIKDGLRNLHQLFSQAPTLGSLIDPTELPSHMFAADYETLRPYLEAIFKAEQTDDETRERAIAAAGMARAAELLADEYTLVITNVPYLSRERHDDLLKEFAESRFQAARRDLATVFTMRIFDWVAKGGAQAAVVPQGWLFLSKYRKLREQYLRQHCLELVAKLGPGAFDAIGGHVVNVALCVMSRRRPSVGNHFAAIDVSDVRSIAEKSNALRGATTNRLNVLSQTTQLRNPDHVILLTSMGNLNLLSEYAESFHGISTKDYAQYGRNFWEVFANGNTWIFQQSTVKAIQHSAGKEHVLFWENGGERLRALQRAGVPVVITGLKAWRHRGVAVSQMNNLPVTLYEGDAFDDNTGVVVPKRDVDLPAIWAFLSSPEFAVAIRVLDASIKVTYPTLVKVPFDLTHWQKVAAERYPHGLPEPQSNDPTQWLFHGHPAGMVAAGPAANSPWGIADPVGTDRHPSLICREPNLKDVLQVAVARLLGYRWPAEQRGSGFQPLAEQQRGSGFQPLDSEEDRWQDAALFEGKRQDAASTSMRLDVASRAWVQRCGELLPLADEDGIVCIPAVRGEEPAAERLRRLLAAAFGEAWSAQRERELIAATGSKEIDLEGWLRNDFFEQHCKLFHDRPFIWHIWDGRKRDGFHALVNYHKLCGEGERRKAEGHAGRRLLESLTYAYLGEWITRQRDGVKRGEGGAEDRLAAALKLQKRLEAILEGEPPFDIFVRWKPLAEQPIGWEPDINDGVRMNIRPFMASDLPGGKKGAGILRSKPNIKWTKDRGKEPERPRDQYPWFWGWDEKTEDFAGGETFDGNRWNGCHYTTKTKQAARQTFGT